jgi:hypothetical protein
VEIYLYAFGVWDHFLIVVEGFFEDPWLLISGLELAVGVILVTPAALCTTDVDPCIFVPVSWVRGFARVEDWAPDDSITL